MVRKEILIIVFSLFILSISRVNAIYINEIYPNPSFDESLNEWIELYNNDTESINITGWMIADNNERDSLKAFRSDKDIIIPPKGYAIITDSETRVYDNFNIPDNVVRIYVEDSNIGNGLNNDYDKIILYNKEGIVVDSVNYSNSEEGEAYAKIDNKFIWQEPSPGLDNEKFLNACDFYIAFLTNQTLFKFGNFTWQFQVLKNFGNKTTINVSAYIINPFGDIIKEYRPFTNTNISYKKTSSKYRPDLNPGSYSIIVNLSTSCNDINKNNNIAYYNFTILGNDTPLLDVYTVEEAKFGSMIKANLFGYSGNYSKEEIKIYFEDFGEITKIKVNGKYKDFNLDIPIYIPNDCKLEDKEYKLIVEGFGIKIVKKIYIEHENSKECLENRRISYEVNYPFKVFNNEQFNITIKIKNFVDLGHNYIVYSYVYSGPKCYCIDRKANLKKVWIPAYSEKEVELNNFVKDAREGKYKLRIIIKRDDRKTEDVIVKEIYVMERKIIFNVSLNDGILEVNIQNKQDKKQDFFFIFIKNNDEKVYKKTIESSSNETIKFDVSEFSYFILKNEEKILYFAKLSENIEEFNFYPEKFSYIENYIYTSKPRKVFKKAPIIFITTLSLFTIFILFIKRY